MTDRQANIVQTVECFYDGDAVSYLTVMKYAECSPDEITQLVKDGHLQASLGATVNRAMGRLNSPLQRLSVKPDWA